MVAAHHPQGWSHPPGGQVRYWIRSAHHAVPRGIGFGAATWQLRARDAWIGWPADVRADNLDRVLCNHRFLALPRVRVQGLAALALCRASARVATDWQDRCQLRPQAVYNYVASDQTGYSYQWAGRAKLGPTRGRRGRVSQVRDAIGAKQLESMTYTSVGR